MKLFLGTILLISSLAHAADTFPACKDEEKKFACKGDDKAIFECLTKHEKELSEKCDKDHEAYEKAHGLKK